MEVLDPPPLPQQRLGAGRCWSPPFPLPLSLPVRWGASRRACDSPCLSPSLAVRDSRGGGTRVPGTLPPLPFSFGGEGWWSMCALPPFLLAACGSERKGGSLPPSPSALRWGPVEEGVPFTPHPLFFGSALGAQEVASPMLPSFLLAVDLGAKGC